MSAHGRTTHTNQEKLLPLILSLSGVETSWTDRGPWSLYTYTTLYNRDLGFLILDYFSFLLFETCRFEAAVVEKSLLKAVPLIAPI
jgi:hypothetical protein